LNSPSCGSEKYGSNDSPDDTRHTIRNADGSCSRRRRGYFADVLGYKSVDGDETLDDAEAVVPEVVVPAALPPVVVAPLVALAPPVPATVVAAEEPVAFKQVVSPELHVKTKFYQRKS
jgi:hypothetical protein